MNLRTEVYYRQEIKFLEKECDKLRAELEAYKKAKAENDERFQLEAGTLRAALRDATEVIKLSYGFVKAHEDEGTNKNVVIRLDEVLAELQEIEF